MLTMTLAELFGAGNCMRDMEFHLLFDRLSLLWMFLKQIIQMTGESVTFSLHWYDIYPAKYQENSHFGKTSTPENMYIVYRM